MTLNLEFFSSLQVEEEIKLCLIKILLEGIDNLVFILQYDETFFETLVNEQ